MATLGHYDEYDEYLRLLAEAQRYKLRLNQHKGFLGDLTPEKLISLLEGEIIELKDAAERGSKIEMLLEAADIANFALGFVIAALRTEKRTPPLPYLEPGCCIVHTHAEEEAHKPTDRIVPRYPDQGGPF